MDKSNGYEYIAASFIEIRGKADNGIGSSSIREWAKALPKGCTILDLGCGTGIPITKVLTEKGLVVYGIDASPTLVKAFRQNFPNAPVACESAEESLFFKRKFDAIVSWGLIFLLPKEAQAKVIHKAANALQPGGRLLFTAPYQETEWEDVMTGHYSRSLGAERYKELLSAWGLSLIEEFEDEGENHYFNAIKI